MATNDIGTGVREDRTRIDFPLLRRERRERVFAEMESRKLDACLFGREANGRYVAGQRRLWTSNTRSWMPTCVVVRATRKVHLLAVSASFEDAPDDLSIDDLYGRSFDPVRMLEIFASLPGLAEARSIGIDGSSVAMRALLARISPAADVIAVEAMMRGLRRRKLAAEIDCIRVAIAIAEASLQAAADALRPGISGQELRAVYLERMCELGTSTFAQQGTFRIASPEAPSRWLNAAEPIGADQLVVLSAGALWAGYEGSLARTWWCGSPERIGTGERGLEDRSRALMDELVARCRAGCTGADLATTYGAAGEALPAMPIAYALGLGHEGPIAGSGTGREFDRDQELIPEMVVALRSVVSDRRRAYRVEEMVRVTEGEPEVLTRMSRGPVSRG